MDANDSTVVAVSLARIEGKLDRLGDSINGLSKESLDHEQRIRVVERRPVVPDEVWARLGALEGQPFVTPKQLAGWLALTLAVIGTATPFLFIAWS